jgi:hypothetical protein
MGEAKALSDVEIVIFKILIDYIVDNKKEKRRGEKLEYNKLAEMVQQKSVIPHNLGLYLGHISEFCIAHDAPPISAIVTSVDGEGKYSGYPGKGFYSLLGFNNPNESQIISHFIKNLNKAYDFPGWNDLLERA